MRVSKEVGCQEKSILVWLMPSRMLRMWFLNKRWLFLSFKGFQNHLLTADLPNIQLSVWWQSQKQISFKCRIVWDECCSKVTHAVEFNLGLVVKGTSRVFRVKSVLPLWTVFCLATGPWLGLVPQPEHRTVTGADTWPTVIPAPTLRDISQGEMSCLLKWESTFLPTLPTPGFLFEQLAIENDILMPIQDVLIMLVCPS